MKASLRKVLRKFLSGFIIIEPYARRSSVRRNDAQERRWYWDGVDFRFDAIEQLTKEGGRERNTQKSTNNINIRLKIKEGMYA